MIENENFKTFILVEDAKYNIKINYIIRKIILDFQIHQKKQFLKKIFCFINLNECLIIIYNNLILLILQIELNMEFK